MSYHGEHSVIAHLAPPLRSGLIQYMAKHDLDKQYALLSLLLKAMRSEDLISQENYEIYAAKYSKTVSSLATKKPLQLTKEELLKKQRLDEKVRYFSMVLDQWRIHSPDWRQKKIKEAQEWAPQVPSAKLVLDLGVDQK